LVAVDNERVVVEAVKLADDRSGDVIVRLYEAAGSHAEATVTFGFPSGEPGSPTCSKTRCRQESSSQGSKQARGRPGSR